MKLIYLFLISIVMSNELYALNTNVIETSTGLVHGIKKKRVLFYEDIPYAKPPIGDLRWKAPRTLISSDLITPKDNNFCVQRPSNLGGADGEGFFVGNEDCLYLDIHTPKKIRGKLPVMFWIHGGGNTSGLKDIYDFSKMVSKHNVIVVRINYRLGPFGWFTHPAIQGLQDDEDKTSNFGTLDIIKALEWVNQNIELFGGDPENVTIFGESAGGHNVLSLLVSRKAKGLFHKAISMSGYTTSVSAQDSYMPSKSSSISNFSGANVVESLLLKFDKDRNVKSNDLNQVREFLYSLSFEDFFSHYGDRPSYEEIPLLTNDDIVIPKIGLRESLSKKEYVNIVPTIAGSNRDEVKLWLATARYFVDLEYSFIGSVLNIPNVRLIDENSFEAFNFYRSSAWQIRGVDDPLNSLNKAGNSELFAYRYDWDDHRSFIVADFKKLIGAAHATEIPLLARNMDLVGGYPLSDLIYPPSLSKRYTSKNMMLFWSNFAKFGNPGISTNSVVWQPYLSNNNDQNYLILDNKKNLKMISNKKSFKSLSSQLENDTRLSDLEKCVALLQMFTFVGNDVYDENIKNYKNECNRNKSERFLKDNASYIEY